MSIFSVITYIGTLEKTAIGFDLYRSEQHILQISIFYATELISKLAPLAFYSADVPYALWFKWQKASVQLRPGGIDHGIRWNIQEGATAEKVLASPNSPKKSENLRGLASEAWPPLINHCQLGTTRRRTCT